MGKGARNDQQEREQAKDQAVPDVRQPPRTARKGSSEAWGVPRGPMYTISEEIGMRPGRSPFPAPFDPFQERLIRYAAGGFHGSRLRGPCRRWRPLGSQASTRAVSL